MEGRSTQSFGQFPYDSPGHCRALSRQPQLVCIAIQEVNGMSGVSDSTNVDGKGLFQGKAAEATAEVRSGRCEQKFLF